MDADNRLVGALFENLTETDWANAFLAGVCEATRSPAGAVLQVDVASRKQTLPAYFGQGHAMAVAFEQEHAIRNPWRPVDESKGPPPGSVVVPDDFLPLSSLRRTEFWADFLRPMRVDHGGGLIGFRSQERVVSLTLLRSAHAGPYDAQERAWLRRVAPHWVNACNLRNRLVPDESYGSDATRALDALGTAAFFFDERGRCTRRNAAADLLLSQGDLVRLRGGHLVAAHPDSGALFASTGATTALRRRDGSVAGHAAAHRLPGHGALGSARTVVFVEPVEATRPRALRQALAAVYGLTPREAELAVRLADGDDLPRAAGQMGIAPGAARTRLKVVFGKTGVRHQGGLVALVKSLRAVLGPAE
ncbi:LuxR family transcriptional regulator [Tahibacter aquaticus]|uniref:LuxR family transcriptional regulator n=1 Tax=Tahibacter aquaticus TaxID=520092 RepID=A0A4R6Z4S5_9GAMM|nr:hypothetical protein [Tahibacter aquaticus]TDR46549.1 LuxR family transcriptional regulator [Tahibacter aquaticus]